MTTFFTADYILSGVALAAAIFGLFGGFSGALGFFAGVVAAILAGKFGYAMSAQFIAMKWGVLLATLVVILLAFGLARVIVKRIVKGLLAQPADALFGSLVAAITGLGLALAIIHFLNCGIFPELKVESSVYAFLTEWV